MVANAIFYNPVLALGQLQQKGALQYLFATWFEMITKVGLQGHPRTPPPHSSAQC